MINKKFLKQFKQTILITFKQSRRHVKIQSIGNKYGIINDEWISIQKIENKFWGPIGTQGSPNQVPNRSNWVPKRPDRYSTKNGGPMTFNPKNKNFLQELFFGIGSKSNQIKELPPQHMHVPFSLFVHFKTWLHDWLHINMLRFVLFIFLSHVFSWLFFFK